jgi:glycosyltransferase involved in cell wall biosynthesis
VPGALQTSNVVRPADFAGKRVLFLVNVDWFFLSHRLPVAVALRDAGADVTVAAAHTGRRQAIEDAGFAFIPLPLSRQGRNPIAEIKSMVAIAHVLRTSRPDLVHQVAVKPVVYGSLVGTVVRRRTPRLNAISGLGFSFSSDERAKWTGRVVRALFRVALRTGRSITIFQNPVDLDAFVRSGLVPQERAALIRGSGVDLERFTPRPPPENPVVLMASRMLWEKGVAEFVAAARIVRKRVPEARFVLVGGPDAGNPTAVETSDLQRWSDEGILEWWGHRSDMPEVLARATIVVLPTFYPEGVPKILLEAAASARPIIATDIAGCREVVRPGVNGILVPPKNPGSLSSAILELLSDPERCSALGNAGREIAERDFSERLVVGQTLALYRRLLHPPASRAEGLTPRDVQPPGA